MFCEAIAYQQTGVLLESAESSHLLSWESFKGHLMPLEKNQGRNVQIFGVRSDGFQQMLPLCNLLTELDPSLWLGIALLGEESCVWALMALPSPFCNCDMNMAPELWELLGSQLGLDKDF